jgi:hypothetical protein
MISLVSSQVEHRRSCCCEPAAAVSRSPAPPQRQGATIGRRFIGLAGWLIPGTLLAFFPKCPLCVAGYVALATGLGLSLTVATYLRWALLAACLASLAYMAIRLLIRRHSSNGCLIKT